MRAAFDGYEAALGANDVAALTGYFWQSPRAVRLMTEGGLYGIEAIAAFRKGRDVSDIARELTRVDIVALGPDVAVATAEYRRTGSGRRGAQSQVWVRRPEGWRIASAHVSLGGLTAAGHAAILRDDLPPVAERGHVLGADHPGRLAEKPLRPRAVARAPPSRSRAAPAPAR